MADYIKKEDYDEACCPLKMKDTKSSVPIRRIIEKLDEYLGRNDCSAAERHLKYWYAEAMAENDMRGLLSILNEQIGLYRKTEKEAECLASIEEALSIAEKLKIDNTVTYGTTLINAATGYKAFGKALSALPLYRKAQRIYESLLEANDARLGGLYNNMALTLTQLKEYDEAESLYGRAIQIMKNQEHGEAETAITYLNLADLAAMRNSSQDGEKTINEYLDKAESLLDADTLVRDGYYAFVCEKCAPIFGYYGYFLAQKKFAERAREIYERS